MIMRIVTLASLVVLALAGCARDEPPSGVMSIAPTKVITRVERKEVRVEVPVCPTDDQLRDSAIEVSVATYKKAPGGSRACACPGDTYKRLGLDMSCDGNSAIKPAEWVMCSREQVPDVVVAAMRAKLDKCSASAKL